MVPPLCGNRGAAVLCTRWVLLSFPAVPQARDCRTVLYLGLINPRDPTLAQPNPSYNKPMLADELPRVPFLRRVGESTKPAVASSSVTVVENVASLLGRLVGQAS